ncbi:hypothetical protein TELCIR_01138, partial [Teladorsagia circumcincta]
AMNRDHTSTTAQRRPILKSSVPNVILGMAIQVARRFLFIDPKKKAIAFLAFVALLSVVGSFITLDDSLYIVQDSMLSSRIRHWFPKVASSGANLTELRQTGATLRGVNLINESHVHGQDGLEGLHTEYEIML